jgi:hypothetical protein
VTVPSRLGRTLERLVETIEEWARSIRAKIVKDIDDVKIVDVCHFFSDEGVVSRSFNEILESISAQS